MSFLSGINSMINAYGNSVHIDYDNKKSAKGFIQPIRYKTHLSSDIKISDGGAIDNSYYLYIGRASDTFITKGSIISTADNKRFVVKRSEIYTVSNKPVYLWAVITPVKEMREDDYDTDTN